MSLEKAIHYALDLTRELHSALKAGQIEVCAELMSKRGTAIADSQAAHKLAGNAEKADCRPLIDQLLAADQQLQNDAGTSLQETDHRLRTTMGTTTNYSGSYNQQPTLACVDRKA